MVTQEQQPRVHRTRHRGGECTRRRHHVQTESTHVSDGGCGRRRALAHQHLRRPAHRGDDADHVATRAVQMRFDNVQHKRGSRGCVEGVTTAFQHRLCRTRRQPMRRSRHPEGSLEIGAGEELTRGREGHRQPRWHSLLDPIYTNSSRTRLELCSLRRQLATVIRAPHTANHSA